MSDESILLAELEAARREIDRLRERIRLAAALTDTGTPEFREAFPEYFDWHNEFWKPNGWRIVERIREVLNG